MKIFILISFLAVLFSLFQVALAGRKYKENKATAVFKKHKMWVRISWILTIISIFIVEAYVRLDGGFDVSNLELFIHLYFALNFLFFLVLSTINNGKKNNIKHKAYVYWVFVFYLCTFITGINLLYQFV